MSDRAYIRIGPFSYSLRIVNRLQNDDGEACNGLEDFNNTEIKIEYAQSGASKWITTWHEILHALLDAAGFESKEHKERVIIALSHGIAQVLVDNPWLASAEEFREKTDITYTPVAAGDHKEH